MKKICFIVLLFYCLIARFAFGQEFDYQRAYKDYLYTYNQYRESHRHFVTIKNQYLTYQTLTAKNQALVATREMLEKRSEVLRTYLTALRLRLAEVTGVFGPRVNNLYLKLDQETNWLSKHHDSLSSPPTLEELLKVSREFENRYSTTAVIIYQALGEIIATEENTLYQRTKNLLSEIEEKIVEIKTKDKEKGLILEHWLSEARKKLEESLRKQNYTKTTLENLNSKGKIEQNFNQAQFALKESNQHLKEVVFYLKEIIRKIKYD